MKVSVIVPVYNTEAYLEKCVDSILAQTLEDFELLLIDDGSTDDSGRICDEYAKKDKRVRVFHKENGGVSRARNLGIENSKGEYLSFVDSDDYIRPQMYEKLVSIADEFGVDLVSSDLLFNGSILRHNNIAPNKVINKETIKTTVLPSFSTGGGVAVTGFTNKIFRRETIKGCFFPEGLSYQEDLIFILTVFATISSMYYYPDVFYEYTPLSTGLYSSYRKGDGINFIRARLILNDLIAKNNINVDFLNYNNGFLYNVSWFVYRTLRLENKKERDSIIRDVLTNDETKKVCSFLAENATSFDKRIARAIKSGKIHWAVTLIKFVHSGKAEKLQRLIAKIRGR